MLEVRNPKESLGLRTLPNPSPHFTSEADPIPNTLHNLPRYLHAAIEASQHNNGISTFSSAPQHFHSPLQTTPTPPPTRLKQHPLPTGPLQSTGTVLPVPPTPYKPSISTPNPTNPQQSKGFHHQTLESHHRRPRMANLRIPLQPTNPQDPPRGLANHRQAAPRLRDDGEVEQPGSVERREQLRPHRHRGPQEVERENVRFRVDGARFRGSRGRECVYV